MSHNTKTLVKYCHLGRFFGIALLLGCQPIDSSPRKISDYDVKKIESPSSDDYQELFLLSSGKAPNRFISERSLGADSSQVELKSKIAIDDQNVRDLECATVFDCSPFVFDNRLRDALTNSTKLEWLRMGKMGVNEKDLESVCNIRSLRGLNARNANLTGFNIQALEVLSKLEWLDLSNAELSGAFEFPKLPNLEVLFFCVTVTDGCLPGPDRCPNLRVFSGRVSSISDDGVDILVQNCPRLRYLNLAFCKGVTEKSIPKLGKLKELKYLHIGMTTLEEQRYDHDYGGIPELQRVLPNCFIGTGD